MADPLRRVQRGQKLKDGLSAAAWNLFVGNLKNDRDTGASDFTDFVDPVNTAFMVWDGDPEQTLKAFSVLGYGDPVVSPVDNPFIAFERSIFENASPAADAPFAITLKPVGGGKVVKVAVGGIVPVLVDVSDEAHTRAVAIDDDTDKLESSADTGVPILWKESGTGDKWAFVLLGDNNSDPDASLVVRGYVNTTGQAFSGKKTFADGAVLGASGSYTASDVNGNLQFNDSTTNSTGSISVTEPVAASTLSTFITNISFTVASQTSDEEYAILRDSTRYPGGDLTSDSGLVFKGGLYIEGDVEFPDSSAITSVQITNSGGHLTITPAPGVSGPGPAVININTSGASGTDADGGAFDDGICETVATLGGVDTTWTVAVGDVVVISKGRIQSITPGS